MLALFFGIGCSFYNYLGTSEISSEIEKVSVGRIQDIFLNVSSLSHCPINKYFLSLYGHLEA